MEVDLLWKSKWNFMKGLYLFQRYLPFIDTTWLAIYFQFGRGMTKTTCAKIYPLDGVLIVFGFAASEMVLSLRTWAVWNRNQRLTIILPILYVLVWGSAFAVLGIYLNSVEFGDPPFSGFQGCILEHANIVIVFLWVQVMIWDTLMLVLMLIPGFRAYRYRGVNSALMKAVYRDGVVYYLFLFALSFLNILLIIILPLPYRHLLMTPERVLHSTFASRVVLHIRAQAENNIISPDGLTELNTNQQIVFHNSEAVQ